MPWLAIGAVAAANRAGTAGRVCGVVLALVGAYMSIPGAILYPSFWGEPAQAASSFLVQAVFH
jgi:hypothetical protein